MFDNGNFRRKRKKRSDPPNGPGIPNKVEDKNNSCSTQQTSEPTNVISLGSAEQPCSPSTMNDCKSPSLNSSHCFSTFVSTMNAAALGRNNFPRQPSGGLGSEFSHGRQNRPSFSSCSASVNNQVAGFELSSQSHSRVNYYAGAASGQSGWLSTPVLSTFSVNNLIYSREGTEV